MGHWSKHPVSCAQCAAELMRCRYRAEDGVLIQHFFCDRVCKGSWQKRLRPINSDELKQLHLEGLSAYRIAQQVGRDPKTVNGWLRDDGLIV